MKSFCALMKTALMIGFASAPFASAQAPAPVPPGPVPPAIVHARSVFISNAGTSSVFFHQSFAQPQQPPYLFSGDQNRSYSEFYAALDATQQYKLQNDPSKADLVLQLELPSSPVPEFRLVIYGIGSPYPLWTITQAIEPALLQQNRDKNFDRALNGLLTQFLQIAGKAPAPAQ